MNAASGVIVAVFPILFTPFLSRKYGIRKTCILVDAAFIPLVLCVSWVYKLVDLSWDYNLNSVLLWILLITLNGFCVTCTTLFVSFISIAVNNSVDSNIVGFAVGISQSFVALSRGTGTFGVAFIFGSSLNWNLFFPFDSHFIFILFAIIALINISMITYLLEDTVEKRKKRPQEIPLIDKELENKGL